MRNSVDPLVRLFEVQGFVRSQPRATLFAPFSRKLKRRVSLYGQRKYELFVHHEVEARVETYNECCLAVPLIQSDGRIQDDAPDAVTRTVEGTVELHLIQRALPEWQERSEAWGRWAALHEVTLRIWTPKRLRPDSHLFENQAALLRFVSLPDYAPNAVLAEAILQDLRSVRKKILNAVLYRTDRWDRTEVEAELARLILEGTISAELHNRRIDRHTEVSVHADIS